MKKFLPHVTLCLVVMLVVAMAGATIIEKLEGTPAANALVYHSWFFVMLWVALVVCGVLMLARLKVRKHAAVILLHVAMIVILAGAACTWLTSSKGLMELEPGNVVASFKVDDTEQALPFKVKLNSFEMAYYPGTHTVNDFVSRLTIINGDKQEDYRVSMNHIASVDGYRFYQSGVTATGEGTILTVTHDPYGSPITHAGYAMLLLAFILFFLSRKTHFAALLKQSAGKKLFATAIMAMAACGNANAQPRVLQHQVVESFSDLLVLHNGRIAPLETMARDVTLKLSGKTTYNGFNACEVVTGWLFYYDDWASQPMIKIKDRELRTLLGIDRWVSFNELQELETSGKPEEILNGQAAASPSLMRAVLELNEKFQIASSLGRGDIFLILPLAGKKGIDWHYFGSMKIPADIDENKWAYMRNGMSYLNELVVTGNNEDACRFLAKLKEFQLKECGKALPAPSAIKAETLYNRLEHTSWVAMALLAAGMALFFIFARALVKRQAPRKWLTRVFTGIVWLAVVYITAIIALRWIAGGHIPLSNGYETMLFMAWCSLLVTAVLHHKYNLILPMGTLAAAFSLLVSTLGENNPAITSLMPVLHSPWLSIHVTVIMMAYALLAILMLNSAMAIILRRKETVVTTLHLYGQVLLYPAVFLLTVGIFVGAVWAGVSWGSYWTWDPKETWALITLLVYALPLHGNSLKWINRPMVFHVYVLLAFVSVLITYFGVNFLLGGMHSYA